MGKISFSFVKPFHSPNSTTIASFSLVAKDDQSHSPSIIQACNLMDEDKKTIYTLANTNDPDNFKTNGQSNEPIWHGDTVKYYSPVFAAGNSCGLREAVVIAVAPDKEMPLTLSNGECLPDCTKVKIVKVMSKGKLKYHSDSG